MGCGSSQSIPRELVLQSRKLKEALGSCEDWKHLWEELINNLEQNQLAVAHSMQDETTTTANAADAIQNAPCLFISTFKELSLQSTELFIASRLHLHDLDIYIIVLKEMIAKEDCIAEERRRLAKARVDLVHGQKTPKSLSSNNFSAVAELEARWKSMQNVIERSETLITETIKSLDLDRNTTLMLSFFDVITRYEELLNSFTCIFGSMRSLVESEQFLQSQTELLAKKSPKHAASTKIAQHDVRIRELQKWVVFTAKSLESWDLLRNAQVLHGWSIHRWMLEQDQKPNNRISDIILKWLHQTDPSFLQNYKGSNTRKYATVPMTYHTAASKVFEEQILIVVQIQNRELGLQTVIQEMNAVAKNGGKAGVVFERLQNRLFLALEDNRNFRITQLGPFQAQYFKGLEQACIELSTIYADITSDLLPLMQPLIPSVPYLHAINQTPESGEIRLSFQSDLPRFTPRISASGSLSSVPSISFFPSIDMVTPTLEEGQPELLSLTFVVGVQKRSATSSPSSGAARRHVDLAGDGFDNRRAGSAVSLNKLL